MSADRANEIFISPVHSDPIEVLDTLVHELVHAVDDCASRHGKEFKKIALAIGLEGKMRQASAGPQLKGRLKIIATELTDRWGPYPHAALRVPRALFTSPKPAPKAACPSCGFRVSMLMKYLDHGPPICPKDNIPMEKKGRWH